MIHRFHRTLAFTLMILCLLPLALMAQDATEEPTEVTTEPPIQSTLEVTPEATIESTAEATMEATAEAPAESTVEATMEATAEVTATVPAPAGSMGQTPIASAMLMDTEGNTVGQVIFSGREDGKTLVAVVVSDLEPGFHGFHVHAVGQCDASTEMPFSSAGGHLSLAGEAHQHHEGDLPLLLVAEDGMAEMAVTTDRFTIADLFDEDGSAIVVHANADNYANIPERYNSGPDEETLRGGDSGSRVACGVIQQGTRAAG
jgi:superoxide dismutase, Cu-Zn family